MGVKGENRCSKDQSNSEFCMLDCKEGFKQLASKRKISSYYCLKYFFGRVEESSRWLASLYVPLCYTLLVVFMPVSIILISLTHSCVALVNGLWFPWSTTHDCLFLFIWFQFLLVLSGTWLLQSSPTVFGISRSILCWIPES